MITYCNASVCFIGKDITVLFLGYVFNFGYYTIYL